MSRKRSLLSLALCLLSLSSALPVAAQSAKRSQRQPRAGAQIPRDGKLTPENFDRSAYLIWLNWYQAQQAGQDAPEPRLTLPDTLDSREAQQIHAGWEKARLQAHMAVFHKAAYQLWFDWYQAQQQGQQTPQPSLDLPAEEVMVADQVSAIWQQEQNRARLDVERLAVNKPQPITQPLAAAVASADAPPPPKPGTEIFDSAELERKAAKGEPDFSDQPPQPARLTTPLPDYSNLQGPVSQRARGISAVASEQIASSMKEAGYKVVTHDDPIIKRNQNAENVVGSNTTAYLVDDNNPTGLPQVVEELQNGNVVKQYTYGLSLLSQRQLINGQWVTSFYVYDGQGHVRFLTDGNGNITDSYEYDSFGNLINQTGNTPNNYLYNGEQFDADLNLYYNRARYLNADTGRFWSQDIYEGSLANPTSLHKYLYANANPVNMIDPSGTSSIEFFNSLNIGSILASISVIQPGLRAGVFSPAVHVTDNPVVLKDSGWTVPDATAVLQQATDLWRKFNINITFNSVTEFACPTPLIGCGYLYSGEIGSIPSRSRKKATDPYPEADIAWEKYVVPNIPNLAKHNTLFLEKIIDPSTGVVGRTNTSQYGKYSGTAITLLSSIRGLEGQGPNARPFANLGMLGTILAHEWGHTFGLSETTTLNNLMNPKSFQPTLTSDQQRDAIKFSFGKY